MRVSGIGSCDEAGVLRGGVPAVCRRHQLLRRERHMVRARDIDPSASGVPWSISWEVGDGWQLPSMMEVPSPSRTRCRSAAGGAEPRPSTSTRLVVGGSGQIPSTSIQPIGCWGVRPAPTKRLESATPWRGKACSQASRFSLSGVPS